MKNSDVMSAPLEKYDDVIKEIGEEMRKHCVSKILIGETAIYTVGTTILETKYAELLHAVESKHEGETRHETALRYIRERECSSGEGQTKHLPESDNEDMKIGSGKRILTNDEVDGLLKTPESEYNNEGEQQC